MSDFSITNFTLPFAADQAALETGLTKLTSLLAAEEMENEEAAATAETLALFSENGGVPEDFLGWIQKKYPEFYAQAMTPTDSTNAGLKNATWRFAPVPRKSTRIDTNGVYLPDNTPPPKPSDATPPPRPIEPEWIPVLAKRDELMRHIEALEEAEPGNQDIKDATDATRTQIAGIRQRLRAGATDLPADHVSDLLDEFRDQLVRSIRALHNRPFTKSRKPAPKKDYEFDWSKPLPEEWARAKTADQKWKMVEEYADSIKKKAVNNRSIFRYLDRLSHRTTFYTPEERYCMLKEYEEAMAGGTSRMNKVAGRIYFLTRLRGVQHFYNETKKALKGSKHPDKKAIMAALEDLAQLNPHNRTFEKTFGEKTSHINSLMAAKKP